MKDSKKHINIELDPELHKKLKRTALENELTMSQFVQDAISEKIDRSKHSVALGDREI